jgi:putative PIN family toxin of toxin-antitoxin system
VRVFLDTNVLVRAFTTRGLSADVLRIVLAKHELVLGEVTFYELSRVLGNRMGLSAETVSDIEAFLREYPVVPKPTDPGPIQLRDPTDQWILASAISAKADVLVTGDGDLLDAADRCPLLVVTPRGFWDRLRRGPGE